MSVFDIAVLENMKENVNPLKSNEDVFTKSNLLTGVVKVESNDKGKALAVVNDKKLDSGGSA